MTYSGWNSGETAGRPAQQGQYVPPSSVAVSGAAEDLVGNLDVTNFAGGVGASLSTFWRGDETWAVPGEGAYQPIDSDLTAIAALATTAFGRGFLDLVDAAAARTKLGLGTAALAASGDFQPVDPQLTDIAALAYASNAGKVITVNAGATAFELVTPTAPPAAPPSFTTVEVDLGPDPRRTGKFTIPGSGMTPGKPVMIQQAIGPYTGKGTLADEAEMDQLLVTANVTSATVITAHYASEHRVGGNFKFDYLIGA